MCDGYIASSFRFEPAPQLILLPIKSQSLRTAASSFISSREEGRGEVKAGLREAGLIIRGGGYARKGHNREPADLLRQL